MSDATKETDITVYGATSFVAKHVIRYLVASIDTQSLSVRITLGGRNPTKLQAVKDCDEFQNKDAITDVFVASGSDLDLLKKMAARTRVVINCAGPYSKYSNMVVQACAEKGADYVDFTGEGYWSAVMRQKHGAAAQKSGARIISLCGYDSIPSDFAVFAAVEALKGKKRSKHPGIEEIKIWHEAFGVANGGTIHTMVDYEWDPIRDFTKEGDNHSRSLRKVPFFVGDSLLLTHPSTIRYNPDYEQVKNSFAVGEWLNLLPNIDRNFNFGVSLPMPMSVINMKVVQASATALKYGTEKLQIRERLFPLGFYWTRAVSIFAFLPMIGIMLFSLPFLAIIRLPKLGKMIVNLLTPPGSGAPDWMVDMGSCAVYAVVTSPTTSGKADTVDRGYAYLSFEGDPGNAVTAQCVCESAFTLLLDRGSLPPKSIDGFGTPAELLGPALLKRFRNTQVRPVKIHTTANLGVSRNEMKLYLN